MKKNKLIEEIENLKKEKNAIVVAHSYQNPEVDAVADFVGDSLQLSRLASTTDAKIIVFCGVYFMAETAKILSPDKKVLLPDEKAGCGMADMINLQKIRQFKAEHKNAPVVCYINSTAEVKSESDVCCTSSNALKVVKNMNEKKVLFVPDENLGSWVSSQLSDVEVVTYNGCCPIHRGISPEEIEKQKVNNPNAIVLAHPECQKSVIEKADFVGSTTQMMDFVFNSKETEFIIATEKGVVDRLSRDIPEKKFILASSNAICENMKLIHLEDILQCLKEEKYEIKVEKNLAQKALHSIERMFELCR